MKKPWPYPRLVAHRGGGSLAPENTLAAIRLGQSLGFRAHEFDVKLTADDVAVLLHDETLERTTNGRGRAADLPWAKVRTLDAGGWHSEAFRGEPPPSFEDAARLLISKGTMAHIEIKPTPGFDRDTGRRVALATRELWKGAATAPLFSSFSFEALMAAKEAAPEIGRGWLIKEFSDADWKRLEALDATSVHTNFKTITPERIREVRDRGYRVMLYTVNEIATAEKLLESGADGLFTDNLREFAQRFPQLI
jgi:glycerophosphoryl diester phosphodiesterase